MKVVAPHKRKCPAMVEAGIEDPDGQAGKDFCTRQCPYPNGCIAFESTRLNSLASRRMRQRAADARKLQKAGWPIEEIAHTLGVSKRTAQGYLEL